MLPERHQYCGKSTACCTVGSPVLCAGCLAAPLLLQLGEGWLALCAALPLCTRFLVCTSAGEGGASLWGTSKGSSCR